MRGGRPRARWGGRGEGLEGVDAVERGGEVGAELHSLSTLVLGWASRQAGRWSVRQAGGQLDRQVVS